MPRRGYTQTPSPLFGGRKSSDKQQVQVSIFLGNEPFPLCGKLGLWITFVWHYMPHMGREVRGGGFCPGRSGRGGRLPPRPKFRCPAPVCARSWKLKGGGTEEP